MERLRLGFIGCGHIACAHMKGYKILKDNGLFGNTSITALCDSDENRAAALVQRDEGPEPVEAVGPKGDPMETERTYVSDIQNDKPDIYTDYRELLKSDSVDAVVIMTPVHTHHEIALEAIKNGKHVFIEKPMAITVKAAKKIVETANTAGVVLGVAETARHWTSARLTRWAVESNIIGQPQTAIGINIGGYWSPDKIVANTPWRHNKLTAGAGASLDVFVHDFHKLRYAFGDIEEVYAVVKSLEPTRIQRDGNGSIINKIESNTDDTVWCIVKFKNGAVGQLLFSWAGRGAETYLPSTFYGTKGCIKGDMLYTNEGECKNIKDYFFTNASMEIRERFYPKGIVDCFALEALDFISSVREAKKPETSGEEGLLDIASAYALIESSRTGKPVKLDEVISMKLSGYEEELNNYYKI
ncbi:MAG: Gfo/Idh/MocA family oxidoreductase [Firmicutes bacterium]|nr:Gfo/Idh/MocA family oxidoreductase [Bacillota bacterium]